ncbi:MAG: calcium-binding protein [Cytophagales bacterium]|nr:MAG: calcium-binding protein [Cytophagales bacterium]TAF59952.1 MAG: calcium-binding protein [Cytophagales bacterium]
MEITALDDERESKIKKEILVDCTTGHQRLSAWYYYLQDRLSFPFKGSSIQKRRNSPLGKNDIVEVLDLSSEDECKFGIMVDVEWDSEVLSVPLAQLEGINVDEEAAEAIKDWHYWAGRGYSFFEKPKVSKK